MKMVKIDVCGNGVIPPGAIPRVLHQVQILAWAPHREGVIFS